MKDPGFWWELIGKLGGPIFAATLVACLLEQRFQIAHLALLATGFGLLAAGHWNEHHRSAPGRH